MKIVLNFVTRVAQIIKCTIDMPPIHARVAGKKFVIIVLSSVHSTLQLVWVKLFALIVDINSRMDCKISACVKKEETKKMRMTQDEKDFLKKAVQAGAVYTTPIHTAKTTEYNVIERVMGSRIMGNQAKGSTLRRKRSSRRYAGYHLWEIGAITAILLSMIAMFVVFMPI